MKILNFKIQILILLMCFVCIHCKRSTPTSNIKSTYKQQHQIDTIGGHLYIILTVGAIEGIVLHADHCPIHHCN